MVKKDDDPKIYSNDRITELMLRMMEDEKINLQEAMNEYKASMRTIQRDMGTIKKNVAKMGRFMLKHDTQPGVYYLQKMGDIPVEEALAIVKMLIGTRTFGKYELKNITDDLLYTVGDLDKPRVEKALTTIKANYYPVDKTDMLLENILRFENWINKHTTIRFTYSSTDVTRKHSRPHTGVPLSLYFANHSFYVVMYIVESPHNEDETGTFVYRLDRFDQEIHTERREIKIPREYFEDEDTIRDKTYLLNSGDIISYQFSYRGYAPTALEQLPNARLKKDVKGNTVVDKSGGVLIEGSLSVNGAYMWVIGQGDKVTVKAPQSLIKMVKSHLQAALDSYK